MHARERTAERRLDGGERKVDVERAVGGMHGREAVGGFEGPDLGRIEEDEAAAATRDEQLAAELEDWSITAHRVASMAVRRDRPTWLVIAVTKADLYPDEVDEAVRYYSPGSGSLFAQRLDELRALAGGAKLSVDVLPVCSQGAGRRTSMTDKDSAALLARLELRMAQLCGHV